jgi:hypothetical protein
MGNIIFIECHVLTILAENDSLSRWELRILSSVRKEVKSEKKIAKNIGLNTLTTSQLITGLWKIVV